MTSARVMVSSSGSSSPRRATVIVTLVSLGPLSRPTASSRVMVSVGSPSIRLMTSPGRMPSRSAGLPAIGVITVSLPSRTPTRMPSP